MSAELLIAIALLANNANSGLLTTAAFQKKIIECVTKKIKAIGYNSAELSAKALAECVLENS